MSKKIPLTITCSPVSATSRKLTAKWSMDTEQDLKALYGFDSYKDVVKVTPYTTKKQFKYDKSCDWAIHKVHGLEDKNGNIYILWDQGDNKMNRKTITREEFDLKYFMDAL